jgi:hypothetical protein
VPRRLEERGRLSRWRHIWKIHLWLVRFSPSAKRQEKRETRVLVSAALMLHDDIFLGGGGVDPRTPFRVRCALARLPATSEPSWWEAHAGAVTDSTHDPDAQYWDHADRTGISELRVLLAYYLCRGRL